MSIRLPIAAVMLLLALPAVAAEGAVPPEKFIFCTVCHGADFMGNASVAAPRLSGMEAWYVRNQLAAFSAGWRGTQDADAAGIEMRPMAQALTATEMAEAARLIAATRSDPPVATISGDAAAGEALYRACAACHGVRGEGNESLAAPALTAQDDWYIAKQLTNFRDGIRGQDPADTFGQQMRAATAPLTDDQAILDVVAYINTL